MTTNAVNSVVIIIFIKILPFNFWQKILWIKKITPSKLPCCEEQICSQKKLISSIMEILSHTFLRLKKIFRRFFFHFVLVKKKIFKIVYNGLVLKRSSYVLIRYCSLKSEYDF